jgi:two-component system sensor histidine kinase HydH
MCGLVPSPGGAPVSTPLAANSLSQSVLEELQCGVVAADNERRIVYVNGAAAGVLRQPAGLLIGRPLATLFEQQGEWTEALDRLAPGQEVRIELVPPGASQLTTLGVGLFRSSLARAPELAYVALLRDLGARRQLDQELRRLERLAAVGQMVSGFAHEVRNPLAGIQALSEVLLGETAIGDPRREYITRMQSLMLRVDHMLRGALAFGEPEPPQRRLHDPRRLVTNALQAPEVQPLREDAVAVELADSTCPNVHVDGNQIVVGLIELLRNALEATDGDARRVHVRLTRQPATEHVPAGVCIDVCDDGPGIPAKLLPRIFDPFFTTKPKARGLGLAIAHTLVLANGGRLLVRSRAHETVFSVLLAEFAA